MVKINLKMLKFIDPTGKPIDAAAEQRMDDHLVSENCKKVF